MTTVSVKAIRHRLGYSVKKPGATTRPCITCEGGRMSIQLSPRTPWTDEELRRMHRMAEQGWTDQEIAAALGRTLSSVQCKRRKVGSTRVRGGDLKVSLAARPCMRCRSPFRPEHRFNRLCTVCNDVAQDYPFACAA